MGEVAKFGDFGLSRFQFGFHVDRHRRRPTVRITDADDRYTDETTVGVSNHFKALW